MRPWRPIAGLRRKYIDSDWLDGRILLQAASCELLAVVDYVLTVIAVHLCLSEAESKM